MDEKLWIINHRKENPKIKQNKIALDFSAKLKKNSQQNLYPKHPSKEWSDFNVLESRSRAWKKKDKKYRNNYKSWGHKTYF